jgi:hypothetical protein
MYILFFQTESMQGTRTYVGRLCDTIGEALEQKEEVINHGWHDETVLSESISIKEGSV